MPLPSTRPPSLGGVDVVLQRALAGVQSPRLAPVGSDDVAAELLARALRDRGWSEGEGGDLHLIVGSDARSDELVRDVHAGEPWVVAVFAPPATDVPPWPGWNTVLVEAGYTPCLFTGTWRLYVLDGHGPSIGHLLSYPAQNSELDASTAERGELVEEIVRWRTAALTRWANATSAAGSGGGTSDEHEVERLRAAVAAAESAHAATRATVSWRLTRPLRAIQSRRLNGARG